MYQKTLLPRKYTGMILEKRDEGVWFAFLVYRDKNRKLEEFYRVIKGNQWDIIQAARIIKKEHHINKAIQIR